MLCLAIALRSVPTPSPRPPSSHLVAVPVIGSTPQIAELVFQGPLSFFMTAPKHRSGDASHWGTPQRSRKAPALSATARTGGKAPWEADAPTALSAERRAPVLLCCHCAALHCAWVRGTRRHRCARGLQHAGSTLPGVSGLRRGPGACAPRIRDDASQSTGEGRHDASAEPATLKVGTGASVPSPHPGSTRGRRQLSPRPRPRPSLSPSRLAAGHGLPSPRLFPLVSHQQRCWPRGTGAWKRVCTSHWSTRQPCTAGGHTPGSGHASVGRVPLSSVTWEPGAEAGEGAGPGSRRQPTHGRTRRLVPN